MVRTLYNIYLINLQRKRKMSLRLEKTFCILDFPVGCHQNISAVNPLLKLFLLLFFLDSFGNHCSSHQQTSQHSTHIFIGDSCVEGIPMYLFCPILHVTESREPTNNDKWKPIFQLLSTCTFSFDRNDFDPYITLSS